MATSAGTAALAGRGASTSGATTAHATNTPSTTFAVHAERKTLKNYFIADSSRRATHLRVDAEQKRADHDLVAGHERHRQHTDWRERAVEAADIDE